MRKISFLIIVVLGVFLLRINVNAAGSNVKIIDEASLLSSSEESELNNLLDSFDVNTNYLIVTTYNSSCGSNTDALLENYYISNFLEYADGVAMIIDMHNRMIYIQGYGEIQNKLTNSDAYDITDNVYKFASSKEYYQCLNDAFVQIDNHLHNISIPRPMRLIVTAILSIILGFLGVFIWTTLERKSANPSVPSKDITFLGAAIATTAAVIKTSKLEKIHYDGEGSSGGSYYGGGGYGGHSSHFGGGHSGGFSGGHFGGHSGGHSGGGHSF